MNSRVQLGSFYKSSTKLSQCERAHLKNVFGKIISWYASPEQGINDENRKHEICFDVPPKLFVNFIKFPSAYENGILNQLFWKSSHNNIFLFLQEFYHFNRISLSVNIKKLQSWGVWKEISKKPFEHLFTFLRKNHLFSGIWSIKYAYCSLLHYNFLGSCGALPVD